MGIRGAMLTAGLLAAISACSPYNYSKEVSALSASVDGLATSVTDGHDELVSDAAANRRRDLIFNQRKVGFPTSCADRAGTSAKDAPPCVVQRLGDTSLPPDPDSIPPDLRKELIALKNYTQALAAVTKSSDRAEYEAAVGKLSSAVSALIAALPGAGTAAAPILAASINIFGWLVGTALDEQRFETLKKAVNLMETPMGDKKQTAMHQLAAGLDGELSTLAVKRRTALLRGAEALQGRIGPGMSEETYRARLAELEAILAVLDSLRKTDPTGAAEGLEKAHKALADALNDPKRNLDGLLTALGAFKEKVSDVQAALTAASAPAGSTSHAKQGS
jgi:hypothetical protein